MVAPNYAKLRSELAKKNGLREYLDLTVGSSRSISLNRKSPTTMNRKKGMN
jgi:hypothetical protein